MRSSLVRAVALIAVPSFIACGGTVVFEEPGEGGGGGIPAGTGGATAEDAVATSATSASGEPTSDVSATATAVTSGPGGGDGGAPSGPVGPGPGGGENPTGGGAPPGPGGVGGADVGNASPSAASSGSGCSAIAESTNQYCYAAETCPDRLLELECEINGNGPWTCWCYQGGSYLGSCTEGDQPSCSLGGCCESYWAFPD